MNEYQEWLLGTMQELDARGVAFFRHPPYPRWRAHFDAGDSPLDAAIKAMTEWGIYNPLKATARAFDTQIDAIR